MDTTALRRQARQRRKALGWGQEDVASRAGVSIGTVQNFELGKSVPQPENLAAILRVLNIDPTTVGAPSEGGAEGAVESVPALLLAETVSRTWPADVSVFLDVIGAYLVRFPEAERLRLIQGITRQIFVDPTRSDEPT